MSVQRQTLVALILASADRLDGLHASRFHALRRPVGVLSPQKRQGFRLAHLGAVASLRAGAAACLNLLETLIHEGACGTVGDIMPAWPARALHDEPAEGPGDLAAIIAAGAEGQEDDARYASELRRVAREILLCWDLEEEGEEAPIDPLDPLREAVRAMSMPGRSKPKHFLLDAEEDAAYSTAFVLSPDEPTEAMPLGCWRAWVQRAGVSPELATAIEPVYRGVFWKVKGMPTCRHEDTDVPVLAVVSEDGESYEGTLCPRCMSSAVHVKPGSTLSIHPEMIRISTMTWQGLRLPEAEAA